MKIIRACCFLFLFSFGACQTPEVEQAASQHAFFDLKAYFAEEIASLSQKRNITKTTQINGQQESHTFDTLDFAQELAAFVESDINRIAWLDQYAVDSTMSPQGKLAGITYQALKPELKTQKLQIQFTQNQPSYIQVNRLMENALMNSAMQMEYRPGEGYRIQSNQKLRISEEREMVVEVKF